MDVSGTFNFFLLGEGEGGVRSAGREGGRFFIEIPGGGGSPRGGWRPGAGRESAVNWGIWGGGGG